MRNRLLSCILAFSVIASALAGAFAVRLETASAGGSPASNTLDYETLENLWQFCDHIEMTSFESYVKEVLQGNWANINYSPTLYFVAGCYDGDGQFFVGIYGTEFSDALGFSFGGNLRTGYVCRGNSYSTNSIYCYGYLRYYNGDTYCDASMKDNAYGYGNYSLSNSSVMNINEQNLITGTPYTSFFSCNFYSNASATIISSDANLVYSNAPVSDYNNIVMVYNTRCYFTISEQDILYSHVGQQINRSVSVTALNNDGDSWTVNLYISDLVFTGLSSWNGVTPVQNNPLLAWDITEYVNSFDWDIITYSCFNPLTDNPTLFSDYDAIIPFEPKSDMWAYWYEKLENLLDYTNTPHEVIPDTIPSYISQKVSSQFLDNIKVHIHGFVCFDGELPTPSFDQILVISESAFDQFIINLDVVEYGVNNFRYNFLSELLQQCDLICIVTDSDFSEIVTDHADNPAWADNYIYYQQASVNIGNFQLNHGLWYMTHAELSTGHSSSVLKPCYSFVTQRYITKCNYWVLSDGIDLLYKGLNAIHDDQTSYFDSAIEGFISVSAAVYASCETLGGKIDLLYNLLSKDYVTKLDSIIDKLDSIVYNTSEEERGFWILPVYEFIEQFVPSISSFGNWIGAIEDFGDSLPVVPQLTIPVFPSPVVTVPVIEGG